MHRTASSPGLRHIDVRTLQQMTPGETYTGWLCKNKVCGRVIAIAAAQLESASATGRSADDQLTAIKCPHCGDEDLYRWVRADWKKIKQVTNSYREAEKYASR